MKLILQILGLVSGSLVSREDRPSSGMAWTEEG